MGIVSTMSRYGLTLFGLAVMVNLALFIFAWLRG